MWLETEIFREDLERICSSEAIPWDMLKNKTIFITGSTGLIGFTVISALLYAEMEKKLGITVIGLVRDKTKAEEMFHDQLISSNALKFVVGDVRELPEIACPVDYIIHGASPTSSLFFVQHPVETVMTAVQGTMNLLELARQKKVLGFAYLSSMEVYGYPEKGHKVTEADAGAFDTLSVRNSYPVSKQLCENLCCDYANEYDIPAKIVRLTQCFGPGVKYADGRVFAEFARCALEHRAIVLKTKGETERSYIYTADAATAILMVMLKGTKGEAYNAANEKTYCSILDMAKMVADNWNINVEIQEESVLKNGYADTLYIDLSTSKLRDLGWSSTVALAEMYQRMMEVMKA